MREDPILVGIKDPDNTSILKKISTGNRKCGIINMLLYTYLEIEVFSSFVQIYKAHLQETVKLFVFPDFLF